MPQSLIPNPQSLIDLALAEDIGTGDITSQLLVPEGAQAAMRLVASAPLVVAGLEVAAQVFRTVDKTLEITLQAKDGASVAAGGVLLTAKGNARSLLAAERVVLNFLQHSCGVATLTRQYVDAVAGTKAKILDTRKTTPGMRLLDKHAVACGGGVNHRMGLYDAVMVKDNHIGIRNQESGIRGLVDEARRGLHILIPDARYPIPAIIVECDTIAQLREALAARPDRILLDNMTPDQLREAVALTAGRVPLEASGGITLANVRAVAETGVDYISVGALTHSARAADISAEIVV